jgi:SAM-dependent methyltransferase
MPTAYEFGRNWQHFLRVVNERRISAAERSLREMLGVDDLSGKRFLDVGSGSGLFSLAARRLGAFVHSFDRDPESVACARELKRRYRPSDPNWVIGSGSVLDGAYLRTLGEFDIVYAWGVLHHTGALWQALANCLIPVAPGGMLFIAIYNDQGRVSTYWRTVKRLYAAHRHARLPIVCCHAPVLMCTRLLPRLVRGRLGPERGMALWFDLKDWLGGYPFEVAAPKEIMDFVEERGCALVRFRACGDPSGNNEFVFVRKPAAGIEPMPPPGRRGIA